MKWKLDFNIEWTSQLAAAAHSFWQAQGVTSLRKLKRLARCNAAHAAEHLLKLNEQTGQLPSDQVTRAGCPV